MTVVTMPLPTLPSGAFAALWADLDLGEPPFPVTATGDAPAYDHELEEALRVLAAGPDLRAHYADDGGRTEMAFCRTPSGRALRAVLRGGEVALGWLHSRRVADGVLELLPDADPGVGRPFQVPDHTIAAALRSWRSHGLRADGVRTLLAAGISHDRAERVLSVLGEAHGAGHAGFAFADTPTGRYAVLRSYGSHVIVPLDRTAMAARIAA